MWYKSDHRYRDFRDAVEASFDFELLVKKIAHPPSVDKSIIRRKQLSRLSVAAANFTFFPTHPHLIVKVVRWTVTGARLTRQNGCCPRDGMFRLARCLRVYTYIFMLLKWILRRLLKVLSALPFIEMMAFNAGFNGSYEC
ncbi:hypothetical protein L484_014129 [Morus notabilis]|uniref:Uncharacterized protein n=1 Tax=Morus notabilis TaxID=981085 RepID=W9RZM3_9ROSA|nr:hypothetical protein L484_014129 [Morus notabilis]